MGFLLQWLIFFIPDGMHAYGQTSERPMPFAIAEPMTGQPLKKHMEFWIDTEKTADLAQAQGETYTSASGFSDSLGHMKGILWIRLRLENSLEKPQKILLEHGYSPSDRVTLFRQLDGAWHSIMMGDRAPFRNRTIDYKNPVFEVEASPGITTLYFKTESPGALTLVYYAWSQAEFYSHAFVQYLGLGLILGVMAVMALYNFFLWMTLRERAYLYYVGCIAFSIMFQLGLHGVGYQLFESHKDSSWLGNEGYLLGVDVSHLFLLFFLIEFLNLKTRMPRVTVVTKIMAGLVVMNIGNLFINGYSAAALITNMIAIIGISFTVIVGLYNCLHRYPPAYIFTFSWLIVLFGTMALGGRTLGLLPFEPVLYWLQPLSQCSEAALLSFALGQRFSYERAKQSRKISELNTSLQKHVNRVEETVLERTTEIRTILDHVSFGFLLVGRDTNVLQGSTRSCIDLFETTDIEGRSLLDLFHLDDRMKVHVKLALEQVFRGDLPDEATLIQIPDRFKLNEKTLSVKGSVVRKDGQIESILFTIIDATRLIKAESESAENSMLINIFRHQDSFKFFIQESRNQIDLMIRRSSQFTPDQMLQILHTIKGNASFFGIDDVADLIHEIEDLPSPSKNDFLEIRKTMDHIFVRHQDILKPIAENIDQKMIGVTPADIGNLKQNLLKNPELHQTVVDHWHLQISEISIIEMLGPITHAVPKLAKKLGKDVDLKMSGTSLKVNPGKMIPITSQLIHLVRNAIDHGIEPPLLRGEKPERGQISIEFDVQESEFIINFEDDGKGLDPSWIIQRAISQGILKYNEEIKPDEAWNLIFHQGFTSSNQVDEISGRGFGLAALRQAVEALEGRIDCENRAGEGCRFSISIPRSMIA